MIEDTEKKVLQKLYSGNFSYPLSFSKKELSYINKIK